MESSLGKPGTPKKHKSSCDRGGSMELSSQWSDIYPVCIRKRQGNVKAGGSREVMATWGPELPPQRWARSVCCFLPWFTTLALKWESLTQDTEHVFICPVNGNRDDSEGASLFRVSQNQEEQARVGYKPGGGQAF